VKVFWVDDDSNILYGYVNFLWFCGPAVDEVGSDKSTFSSDISMLCIKGSDENTCLTQV